MSNRLLDRMFLDSLGWRLFARFTLSRDVLPRAHLPHGARVLDVGAAAGAGARALLALRPDLRLDLVEPDPVIAAQAERNLAPRAAQVRVHLMDATALDLPDQSYDAVLFFESLHHIADWRRALREARRVLRPGGCLLVSEALRDLIALPVLRSLFPHPQAAHFDPDELALGLSEAGFVTPWEHTNYRSLQIAGVARTAPEARA